MSYFHDIQTGIRTTLKGLSLTFRHLRQATKRRTPVGIADANYFELQNGLVTLQYPYEQLPIPDNGRYRLRNEIEDCIVCDKCAKICPVDCITIDAIKATEEVGRASDGSPIRLYAATFDIDMAKCCYCGLCTVVCPTECLTMDKKFDYSEFELGKLTYEFANLTPQEADEKRTLYEQFVLEKEAAKAAQVAAKPAPAVASDIEVVLATAAPKRPVFRPTAKPATPPASSAELANAGNSATEHPLTDATPAEMEQIAQGGLEAAKRPVFQPTQKPAPKPTDISADGEPADSTQVEKPAAAKPAFRPGMKPPKAAEPAPEVVETPKPKPTGFRPTMKPPSGPKPELAVPKVEMPVADCAPEQTRQPIDETPKPKPKPAFRPSMKPKPKPDDETV